MSVPSLAAPPNDRPGPGCRIRHLVGRTCPQGAEEPEGLRPPGLGQGRGLRLCAVRGRRSLRRPPSRESRQAAQRQVGQEPRQGQEDPRRHQGQGQVGRQGGQGRRSSTRPPTPFPAWPCTATPTHCAPWPRGRDVKKITAIVPKSPDNKNSDIDTRALEAWSALKRNRQGRHHRGAGHRHRLHPRRIRRPGHASRPTRRHRPPRTCRPRTPGSTTPRSSSAAGTWSATTTTPTRAPPSYQPVPKPDSNPLDCASAGHGSHVSGTAAGYGVNADGTTFTGDYTKLTADEGRRHAHRPGLRTRRHALVGIRVFGCDGSSAVVGQALDYVLDPNNDGNFDDRAQIVNMSLGSDHSPVGRPGKRHRQCADRSGHPFGGGLRQRRGRHRHRRLAGQRPLLADRGQLRGLQGHPRRHQGQCTGRRGRDRGRPVLRQLQLHRRRPRPSSPARSSWPRPPTPSAASPFAAGSLAGKWVWLKWSENLEFPCGSAARFNNAAGRRSHRRHPGFRGLGL